MYIIAMLLKVCKKGEANEKEKNNNGG